MGVKVQSGGVSLNVERFGKAGGPPVLLLHAFPLSHRMWEPQFRALEDRYQVIAPDHRGFGASEAGDGQTTMEMLVDDALAVLDQLGLDRVSACGLSMGGYVLLRALERAPERFRAVVLADTRSTPDDDAGRLGRANTMRDVKAKGVAAFAEPFSGKLLGPSTLERNPDLRAHVVGLMRANGPLGVCGGLLALALRTDTTAALRKLSVPALIVVGDEDGLTPPAQSKQMAEAAPGSKLVVIPNAGHLSNLEAPDAFNRALLDFLAGLPA
jgi:pimeloyl-ACP methyl ester carboxylesterase